MKDKNIRTMEVTTGSGKDVKDTSQLSGQAEKTAAEKTTNVTKQYTTSGGAGGGPYGGKPSGD